MNTIFTSLCLMISVHIVHTQNYYFVSIYQEGDDTILRLVKNEKTLENPKEKAKKFCSLRSTDIVIKDMMDEHKYDWDRRYVPTGDKATDDKIYEEQAKIELSYQVRKHFLRSVDYLNSKQLNNPHKLINQDFARPVDLDTCRMAKVFETKMQYDLNVYKPGPKGINLKGFCHKIYIVGGLCLGEWNKTDGHQVFAFEVKNFPKFFQATINYKDLVSLLGYSKVSNRCTIQSRVVSC